MRRDDVVLTVALARPGRVLSPNSRSHWAAKQRVVREARGRARLLMLRALARLRETGEPGPATPRRLASETPASRSFVPTHYDVTWYYWGGTGPDADNALASCKAYLDGCCDALGVNDRVLDCAGIHRVKDREQEGTVLLRFWREARADENGGSAELPSHRGFSKMNNAGPLPRVTVLKHFLGELSMLFCNWLQDSPRRGSEPGGAGLHLSSWMHLRMISRTYQTIARIVTTWMGVGLLFIFLKCRTHLAGLPRGAAGWNVADKFLMSR